MRSSWVVRTAILGARVRGLLTDGAAALVAGSLLLGCACGAAPGRAETQAAPVASTSVAQREGEVEPAAGPSATARVEAPVPVKIDPSLRWIIAGGGALPESNQVSIEQDLGLALRLVEGSPGVLLFAGGPGTRTVQVQRDAEELEAEDPVVMALADLFSPRGGRGARYRPTTLPVAAEASASSLLRALTQALAAPGAGPLFLYVAGHGDAGAAPRDNTIALWGQSRLSVAELAEVVDTGARPLALVLTTCFSGGFAELAFAGADPVKGAAMTPRCGLFASTWDLEASGCDPNPDRRAQEGYGLHFLAALRGHDRDGESLPVAELDLDEDGRISLLEAHTRARIAARGIGVPTTTSERWLREVAPGAGRSVAIALLEEEAVIRALGAELGIDPAEPASAAEALAELERAIDDRKGALLEAQLAEDRAYGSAAAAILGRWPVLDDPWHPDFATMLEDDRAAIASHLEVDATYRAYLHARGEADRIQIEIGDLRGEAARYERLARAIETLALAGRLAARGGADWDHYAELLACERSLPPVDSAGS